MTEELQLAMEAVQRLGFIVRRAIGPRTLVVELPEARSMASPLQAWEWHRHDWPQLPMPTS